MSTMTVALGKAVKYGIQANQAGCEYTVKVRDRKTNALMGVQKVVTDPTGEAMAVFANLPVGEYQVQGFGHTCGKCSLMARNVDVILDCSQSNCGDCNPCGGCSTSCSVNWNVTPRTFVSGVNTSVNYTGNGKANCRLKVQLWDGDNPVIDILTGQPLFFYINLGQNNTTTNNWPGIAIGRDYNYRPAPMAEQDPCLQACTIAPARIDIDVTSSNGACSINWNIGPAIIQQDEFATLNVSGAIPGCEVVFLQFDENGDPLIISGQQLRVTVPTDGNGNGALFLGPCSGEGTQIFRPATGSNQNACAAGCSFNVPEQSLTCTEDAVGAIPFTPTCVAETGESRIVFTLNPAEEYQFFASDDNGATWDSVWGPDDGNSSFTHTFAFTDGRIYRMHNVDDNVYSSIVQSFECDGGTPTSKYYCQSGNCIPAAAQPSGSSGPFNTLGECQLACSSGGNNYSIRFASGSPAPSACSNLASSLVNWAQGEFQSFDFTVTGGASSSVNITGIPSWMTRTNGPGLITLSGAPSNTSPFTLTFSAPGCSFTWANVISGGCNVAVSISPTTYTANTPTSTTYSASGPAGCMVIYGLFYDNSPVLIAGTSSQVTVAIPCGSSVNYSPSYPSGTGTHANWRALPMNQQPACLQGCNISPQQINLTVTG